jgi:ubiquinone/menaquinone biosynthesis C-methylase UbiE
MATSDNPVVIEPEVAEAQTPTPLWGPDALQASREARRRRQGEVAERRDQWVRSNRYFYDRMKRLLRFIIEPGKRVLEIRCQTGHLLASVEPSHGVGVEISERLVETAKQNYPQLRFVTADPEDLQLDESFDYLMVSHLFDTVDILAALRRARRMCRRETRVVVCNYNPLWQPLLELASKLGLRAPFEEPNWMSERDITGFLDLADFSVVRTYRLFLLPKYVPLLSSFCNEVLGRLPGIRRLCLMQFIVARPKPQPQSEADVSVSVVIPCRNERDNVEYAVRRIPEMGRHTEIIFCDDKSTDGTGTEVERMMREHPDRNIRLIEGPGICKAENVWTGFRAAKGNVLMILDGDLAVMPEELPHFLRALLSGSGEFINGSRLVYPIPRQAMKFSNMVGNKLFGMMFSYLLDQRIKDTLCGTKVLWRKDWLRIERNLGNWGMKDLWGDYELLFGACKLQLQIQEIPVHYQERIYGVTKMTKVFSNGTRMLRICRGAWRRLLG